MAAAMDLFSFEETWLRATIGNSGHFLETRRDNALERYIQVVIFLG